MNGVTVSKFDVSDIVLKIPPRFAKLAPDVLKPKRATLSLSGCSNAIANGIRRVICNELDVKYLHCEYEDIKGDPFTIPEMIQRRLRMIPLLQSVPAGTKFSLEFTNTGTEVADVKMKSVTSSDRGKYFDTTYTLLTIGVGYKATISNIVVKSSRGYYDHYGMCVVAVHTTSICKDVIPYNAYTDTGQRTQMADPRVWDISFRTNGTMEPRAIIIAACNDLIARVESINELLHSIANNEDEYVLTIPGESDTIGNLIVKTALELYPDIEYISSNVPTVERTAIIKIKYSDDINTLYKNTIAKIVETYKQIRDSV
jgi:DNA-directed RNA polymerase subunit L